MNRVKIYTGIAAITLLFLSACESIIEFKSEDIERKIVIYALLQPDSVIAVSVAEGHSIFEEKYEPRQITDAVVRLYTDGTLTETLAYMPPEPLPDYLETSQYSHYVSGGTKPNFGSTYRIEVEVPGLGTAYGEAELPVPVPITGVDTLIRPAEWGEKQMIVKLSFRDPAGEENLYRLTARDMMGKYYGDKQEPYSPEVPVTITDYDVSYSSYKEPLIAPRQEDDIFGMYLDNSYYLFTDELIAGKEYTLTMTLRLNQPDTDYYEFSNTYIMLHSVSRDLYLGLQSYSAHMQTRDNFLAEPVPVYTNITNGLGIVGAMSSSAVSLIRGDYPVEGVYYEYDRGY